MWAGCFRDSPAWHIVRTTSTLSAAVMRQWTMPAAASVRSDAGWAPDVPEGSYGSGRRVGVLDESRPRDRPSCLTLSCAFAAHQQVELARLARVSTVATGLCA